MLPGLTRTAAQPASIAAKTYFGCEVDVRDDRDLRLLGDDRQRVGVVLTRHRHADDVAAGGGQLGDTAGASR